MKKIVFLLNFVLISVLAFSQPFKYVLLTDTHVGSTTGEEDLIKTVADINEQPDIDFILVTGDITEMGSDLQLKLAKQILAGLKKPYYVIPGNHDTGWSESGGTSFLNEFGSDKFMFDFNGFRFIGCASGPYVRMSDGHIPREAIIWLDSILQKTPAGMPVVFVNHYPIDNSLDNWYEVLDRLKKCHIQYAICGHGHRNKSYNFEQIPGVMGRSNLRAKENMCGYNVVTMHKDSVFFAEKNPGLACKPVWKKLLLKPFVNDTTKKYPRPDFKINATYKNVKQVWKYHSAANVSVTPAHQGNFVVIGNSLGYIEALHLKTGRKLWSYPTAGSIYSSPAICNNTVIIGSGDGNIYALNLKSGELKWKVHTEKAVLGSPLIDKGKVYIGGSDHKFRCLDLKSGVQLWSFNQLNGPVFSKPISYQQKIIFGCLDKHLYALDKEDGSLLWKWNNASGNLLFSPAMCIPVATRNIVFIVAPDRFITAINASTGKTLWRNNEATVRESIGISKNTKIIYGKTMMNDIVAYAASSENKGVQWRYNAGFGYEHVPSMLLERKGEILFGTRNGVVYAIRKNGKGTVWSYKIDNSMVNTVNPIKRNKILVATVDGVVTLLKN